jgi:hypothetical protein
MASGRNYEFILRGENGRYAQSSRIVLPSVTTIVNAVFAKPQLVPWSVNTTIDAVTGIVSLFEKRFTSADDERRQEFIHEFLDTFTDYELLTEYLQENQIHHENVTEVASERGTGAHALLASLATVYRLKGAKGALAYAERILKATDDPYRRAVAGWWLAKSPKPLFSEQVVYSLAHRYAGRLDFIDLDGLLDLKTRRSDLSAYKSDEIQLDGYKIAVDEMGLLEGTPLEGCPLKKRVLLASEDGEPAREVDAWVPDGVFVKIVQLYYLLRKTRVK